VKDTAAEGEDVVVGRRSLVGSAWLGHSEIRYGWCLKEMGDEGSVLLI
jgi:hypothetical protein